MKDINYSDIFSIKTFIHHVQDESIHMDFHVHNSYEFAYIEDGNAEVEYIDEKGNKVVINCYPNQIIIIPPNLKHHFIYQTNISIIVIEAIRNDTNFITYLENNEDLYQDDIVRIFLEEKSKIYVLSDASDIKSRILKLVKLESDKYQGEKNELYFYEYNIAFSDFLISLYKSFNVNLKEHHSKYINECLVYMHNNLSNENNIQEMASAIGVSESYLKALFKKEMGVSIHKYLTNLRIDFAIQCFKTSFLSQNEIAIKSGFKTYNTMHKCFLRERKKSSKEYQKEAVKEAVQYFNNDFKKID